MKLRIVSDLHLEYSPFKLPALASDPHTTLILAGDIANLADFSGYEGMLCRYAQRFRHVVLVPGNHEFYDHVLQQGLTALATMQLPHNVHILDNRAVMLDGVRILGCTLWTNMNNGDPFTQHKAGLYIRDYHAIGWQPNPGAAVEPLKTQHTRQLHAESVQWLENELTQNSPTAAKTVVITHHLPSLQCVDPFYASSDLNGAFASDLDALWERHRPHLLIHGHTHSSVYKHLNDDPNLPLIVANPRGYSRDADRHPENNHFDPFLVVKLEP